MGEYMFNFIKNKFAFIIGISILTLALLIAGAVILYKDNSSILFYSMSNSPMCNMQDFCIFFTLKIWQIERPMVLSE